MKFAHYLISTHLFWLDKFHIDGCAWMLSASDDLSGYSRKPGE